MSSDEFDIEDIDEEQELGFKDKLADDQMDSIMYRPTVRLNISLYASFLTLPYESNLEVNFLKLKAYYATRKLWVFGEAINMLLINGTSINIIAIT